MTHRPPATSRRPTSLRGVATLAALVTLVLSVVTMSTLPSSDETTSAAGRATTPTVPTTTVRSSEQNNPAAAADGTGNDPGTRQPNSSAGKARKVHRLADHPLLSGSNHGLPEIDCALPAWRDDPEAAEQFFTTAKDCLDAAWEPVMHRHHLPFRSPTLHFPTGDSFRTACGTIEIGTATAAYYCKGDLYVPYSGLQTDQYGNSPGIYLALFAHEYGHHVQELSGIMDAAWDHIYRLGRDSDKGLEMSRRKELQAQCFSGMFLTSQVGTQGTITQQMFSAAWADQLSRGDDNTETRKHGSNAHYAEWWQTGARTNTLADCDTFDVSKSAVS